MNSENIFLEIVKDLLIYSKSDILILAKKYNIPFINKSQAVYVIAYKIFSENFSNVGRMRSVHGDSSSRDEDNDEEKYPREEVKEAPSTDVVNPIGDGLEVVNLLLENSAAVNGADKFGKIALIRAAQNGHIEVVKILLENGADMNDADNDGKTALMTAAEWGHADVVELLLDVVELLLDVGANVNDADNYGKTALMFAARWGYADIVNLLLENGAVVNIADNDGKTALMFAAMDGYTEVVKILLENRADVNAANEDGWSVLMFAAEWDNADVVKILLDAGADVNTVNEDRWTALMRAVVKSRVNVVKILLDAGADVNAADEDGRTALYIAARRGHADVVKILLEKDNIDRSIQTALKISQEKGHTDIATLIIKYKTRKMQENLQRHLQILESKEEVEEKEYVEPGLTNEQREEKRLILEQLGRCCSNDQDSITNEKWSEMNLEELKKLIIKDRNCYNIEQIYNYINSKYEEFDGWSERDIVNIIRWPNTGTRMTIREVRQIRNCVENSGDACEINLNAGRFCRGEIIDEPEADSEDSDSEAPNDSEVEPDEDSDDEEVDVVEDVVEDEVEE